MEETDVCYSTPSDLAVLQAIPNGCRAKEMSAEERCDLAVQALARNQTITALADEHDVSRKFVARQAATAQVALEAWFNPG